MKYFFRFWQSFLPVFNACRFDPALTPNFTDAIIFKPPFTSSHYGIHANIILQQALFAMAILRFRVCLDSHASLLYSPSHICLSYLLSVPHPQTSTRLTTLSLSLALQSNAIIHEVWISEYASMCPLEYKSG